MAFSICRPRVSRLPDLHRRYASKFHLFGDGGIPPHKTRHVPISGSYPMGFVAGSICAGIRKDGALQPDLVIVASNVPSHGAACFTRNEFPSGTVTASKSIMAKNQGHGLRGVVANSWCANLLTGTSGIEDALRMCSEAHTAINGEKYNPSLIAMSTGMAVDRLPLDRILPQLPVIYRTAGSSHDHWLQAAQGIRTTDTFPKLLSRTFTLPSTPNAIFSIAGITKGAGMIHPNMATTLGIMCTDANIAPGALQKLLSAAVDRSYNCVSIEGDTSTNDSVALFANGAAGGQLIEHQQSTDYTAFSRVLAAFSADLAKLVVRDGEGATKFVTIRIRDCPSYALGRTIASVVARSVLVKAGLYGGSQTWASVLAAVGYSLIGTEFEGKGIIDLRTTSVSFLSGNTGLVLPFLKRGEAVHVDAHSADQALAEDDIEIVVDLKDDGKAGTHNGHEAVYWTCDLTHEFITYNSGREA